MPVQRIKKKTILVQVAGKSHMQHGYIFSLHVCVCTVDVNRLTSFLTGTSPSPIHTYSSACAKTLLSPYSAHLSEQ